MWRISVFRAAVVETRTPVRRLTTAGRRYKSRPVWNVNIVRFVTIAVTTRTVATTTAGENIIKLSAIFFFFRFYCDLTIPLSFISFATGNILRSSTSGDDGFLVINFFCLGSTFFFFHYIPCSFLNIFWKNVKKKTRENTYEWFLLLAISLIECLDWVKNNRRVQKMPTKTFIRQRFSYCRWPFLIVEFCLVWI